jgi:predicted amidohydrolase
MKLAMAQISLSNDIENNYKKTLEYIENSKGCDLIFFPEVQLTPFFPQYEAKDLKFKLGKSIEELSLTLDDVKIREICKLCKRIGMYVSPNFYVKDDTNYYDMSLFINPNGEIVGNAKMVHILQAENFYERDYYTQSDDGFKVFETPFGKVGIVICFDRHLPESIRTCTLKGAELIIIPTANTIAENLEMFEWELKVQAYQNNVYIAMCNRVGKESNMEFAGQSLVVDCDGNTIFKADGSEQLIVQELDLTLAKESRKRRPYITTRRKDMYL